MDELSYEVQNAIEDLRMRVKNVFTPDMYDDALLFYRFLKARDFDVDESEKMLQKHLAWRKLFQIDNILEDFQPDEFFTKYIEPNLLGLDKDGDAILYFAGTVEMREVLKCVQFQNYMKHWVWWLEKTTNYLKQLNKIRECKTGRQIVIILNLEKLTFGNATYKPTAESYLDVTNHFQNNYPEYMKAAYIINAPRYALPVLALVKAIMSNAMIRKLHYFGHAGWKEKLLEAIHPDVLPAFLGGNRTDSDGDPLCKSFVTHSDTIPPEYYLSNEERYLKDKPVNLIIIPKRARKEICIDIKELDSIIHWQFYSKSNIGFGLFRKYSDEKVEEVIPVAKYTTSDGASKDSFKARSIGKYIFVFDNTYSWLSSKEVHYCIKVTSPKQSY